MRNDFTVTHTPLYSLIRDIYLMYFAGTLKLRDDPHTVSRKLRYCYDRQNADETMHKDIFIHPQFNAWTYENNIALIRLPEDLKFSLEEHAVCLWSSGMPSVSHLTFDCYVIS